MRRKGRRRRRGGGRRAKGKRVFRIFVECGMGDQSVMARRRCKGAPGIVLVPILSISLPSLPLTPCPPPCPPPPRPLPDARRGSRSRREDSRVGTTSRHGTREAHQHHEVKEGKKESSVRGKLFKDVVKQGCGGSETTSCLFGSVCKTTDW